MTQGTLPLIESYPKTILLYDDTQVWLRPLEVGDEAGLRDLFERLPENERFYLKEDVTSPEVIHKWIDEMDLERVIPIVALYEGHIIADATLHRSRSLARRHIGEVRIAVDPAFREVGLGRRLIRELLDIASSLGLHTATFELVAKHEEPAIMAAMSVGFQQVGILKDRIRDIWGEYQDLVLLEISLRYHELANQY